MYARWCRRNGVDGVWRGIVVNVGKKRKNVIKLVKHLYIVKRRGLSPKMRYCFASVCPCPHTHALRNQRQAGLLYFKKTPYEYIHTRTKRNKRFKRTKEWPFFVSTMCRSHNRDPSRPPPPQTCQTLLQTCQTLTRKRKTLYRKRNMYYLYLHHQRPNRWRG